VESSSVLKAVAWGKVSCLIR